MLRITVELVPYGVEEHKRTLGTMIISNDASAEDRYNVGNYDVRQLSEPKGRAKQRTVKKARVENHPRAAVSVWKLVAKALKELGHDR